MKPITTPHTNFTFVLDGGTPANDLPVELTHDEAENRCIRSVWEPSQEERDLIAQGMNLYLVVWGDGHPPVALGVGPD